MTRLFRFLRLGTTKWPTSYTALAGHVYITNEKEVKAGDTQWIDGIRGIAAVLVVTSHIIMALHDHFVYVPSQEAMYYHPSHWPFIHAPAEGFPWLATFFVLSGWVNALKPISLVDAGESDRALAGLASGCLRRGARLMLPPTITTVISWVMAQLGAYKMAKSQGNAWMTNTSPEGSKTWILAVYDLGSSIYSTWTNGTNYYDGNQWCMLSFLKGSMTLYLVLMATTKATQTMRRVILGVLFLWSWKAHDEFVSIPTYGGILLAEFSSMTSVKSASSTPSSIIRILSFVLVTFGWFMISTPNIHLDWSPFFHFIIAPGSWFGYFYPNGCTIYHITNYIGLFSLFVGIVFSLPIQRFFAHPVFVRLGQLSLPIYLLHGPVLRSLGANLLYLGSEPGTQVSMMREVFALSIFAVATLFLAKKWEEVIEPSCAKATKFLDDLVTGKIAFGSSVLPTAHCPSNGMEI